MNAKWYFGALFLIFSYFGMFQEPITVPNQEIVLEFINSEVDQKEVQNTIEDVRAKLSDIGVSEIHIEETENGTLKISYYSLVPIDHIKEALLDENELVVDQNSKGSENDQSSLEYKIDVYEIVDGSDITSRNNKLVFEIKYHSDRFTNDHHDYVARNNIDAKASRRYQTAYQEYKNDPFIQDRTSHKEPEVRAGPTSAVL